MGLATVAGCSGTGPSASSAGDANPPAASAPAAGSTVAGGAPAGTVPGDTFEEQSMNVGRQFSQCAREHGQPDFPDPVFSGGLGWPGVSKQRVVSAEQSCAPILRRLASVPQAVDPPSPATLEHMRQFADCMREQGVTAWPDPKPDGTFPLLGTPLAGMAQYSGGVGVPANVMAARMACRQFEQEWRVAAS